MCMASFSSKSTIKSSYTISSFHEHTYLPSLIHNNLIKRFIGQSLQKTFRAPRKGYSFQPISILFSLKLVISVLFLQVIIIYFDWILINIIIQSLNKRAAVTLLRSMANHGGAIIAMDAAERASPSLSLTNWLLARWPWGSPRLVLFNILLCDIRKGKATIETLTGELHGSTCTIYMFDVSVGVEEAFARGTDFSYVLDGSPHKTHI